MAKHMLSRTWQHPVDIDGARVTLQFRRMTVQEFIEWERQYLSYAKPAADDNDEQAITERGLQAFTWLRETLDKWVRVPAGELEIDGVVVESGADLYDAFGTDLSLMWRLMNHIWAFHRFDERTRKNLLSLSDSPATSVPPATEAAGPRPDLTAGSVENAGSAPTEDARLADAPTAELSGAIGTV